MSRVVLSSLESMIQLLRANPGLTAIPALQGLRSLVEQPPSSAGCCGQKPDLTAHRVRFESALRALTDQQVQDMKRILGVTELAYYSRDGHQLTQKVI